MSIETEPIAEELIASEASASARKKNRGSQTEGRTCLEDQEGRGSATAVIAREAEWREVYLPVLWQRRSRSVVQEEAGRALPRLLQAALRFGRTQSEGCAHTQGEDCSSRRGRNRFEGRAPRWPGPSRVFSLMKRTSSLSGMNQRRPSACSCAFQSSGRSTRRMRLKTVRSGGWWPSAIASMILGEKKPSRSNRRTERLSRCSRRAISSTELTCPRFSSSVHRRARATALSSGSSTRSVWLRPPAPCAFRLRAVSAAAESAWRE